VKKTGAFCLWFGILLATTSPVSAAWKKQEPLPTSWYFHDIDIISLAEGWSVSHPTTGDHGSIFHTVNGGNRNYETKGKNDEQEQ
jgi:hypothetical protein